MAGTYADVPGHRMAIDRDGSSFVRVNHNAGTVTTLSGLDVMNKEDGAGASTGAAPEGNYSGAVIFPELRDIVGVYHGLRLNDNRNQITNQGFHWSADTTNGLDGTWTNLGNFGAQITTGNQAAGSIETDKTLMRNNITSHAISGAKAVRWRVNFGDGGGMIFRIRAHIYGGPASGVAPDRLRFYDPTSAAEVGGAYFDWGDIARGSSVSRNFRIHNPSATLTANGVTVSMEALTETSPANTGQHEFSTDGGTTWATTASLGDLAPGATSSVITLRRVTSASAVLSLWWTRMVASASSWT